MLKKILAASLFVGLLVPAMAEARPPKGYAKAVRGAVSAATGVKASQVRYRSKPDRQHDADGHVHIVGHEVRNVTFRVGRGTGTAKTDNTPIGGPTRVFDLKLDPIAPNH